MCELVWGELGTFVKKGGFGENTPFIKERPAARPHYPFINLHYNVCDLLDLRASGIPPPTVCVLSVNGRPAARRGGANLALKFESLQVF